MSMSNSATRTIAAASMFLAVSSATGSAADLPPDPVELQAFTRLIERTIGSTFFAFNSVCHAGHLRGEAVATLFQQPETAEALASMLTDLRKAAGETTTETGKAPYTAEVFSQLRSKLGNVLAENKGLQRYLDQLADPALRDKDDRIVALTGALGKLCAQQNTLFGILMDGWNAADKPEMLNELGPEVRKLLPGSTTQPPPPRAIAGPVSPMPYSWSRPYSRT